MFNKYVPEINKNNKFLYLGKVEFSSGTTVDILPSTYDSAMTSVFVGITYMTMKCNEVYAYDFKVSNRFNRPPSTRKNSFSIALFSKKTCTNPLELLNRATYECATSYLLSCSPEYVDIDVNESTAGISGIEISNSKRYLVVCWTDKVIIYKFNGVEYAKFQTLLMSTDCKDVEGISDLSILAVVGTNLFEVYTFKNG